MFENPQFRRVDATTSYQKELDLKVNQQFPFVDSLSSINFRRYKDGESYFASFDIKNPKIAREVLQIAIERAADNQNGATYSHHGAQHEVFQESLSRLKEAVSKGKVTMGFQSLTEELKCGSKMEKFAIERLLVHGERFDRKVFRPIPYQYAQSLHGEEKSITKNIRKASIENGIPFGLLVGLYKGLEIQQIFNILGNKEFRTSLPNGTKTFNILHPEDKVMITALSKALLEITPKGRLPKTSSDAYISGTEILRQYNWPIPQNISGTDYGFAEISAKPYPKAVFAGMVQIAQEQANREYLDPARSEYIFGKYENIATTKLITSFLVFNE